jgi:hypothetical protein
MIEVVCAYSLCGNLFAKVGNKKFCSDQCRHGSWAKGHRAQINAQNAKNKTTQMLARLKHRATKAGIPFNIDKDDIIIPTHCPVLGIKLHWNQGKGYHPDSPSVDKINPNLGYVKGNVRVISARANLLKNDATIEELTKVLEDLRALNI